MFTNPGTYMFKTIPKQNPPVSTSHKSWGWLQLQGLLGGELHDPTNIIVMQKPLEKRFDAWDWTIIPEGPDDYRVSCIANSFNNKSCNSVSHSSTDFSTFYILLLCLLDVQSVSHDLTC